MRRLLPFVLSLLIVLPGISQEIWSLERCIRTGLDANIAVRQADLNARATLLEKERWQYAMLPTINGAMSFGYQFGRTIDPTSNAFIEATTNFSNGQVNASLLLFDGLRVQNSRRQAALNALAGKAGAEDSRNNAALQIATAYINILFAQEQAETARRQRELTRAQLDQVTRLVNAGLRPDIDRISLASQLAQSDYQLILQDNALDQAFLALKQLLLLDPGTAMQIERPDVDPTRLPDPGMLDARQVYEQALLTQPVVKAARLQEQSAELSDDIARAGLMPSLRLFGGLSSAYSNNFLDFANPDLSNTTIVPGTPQPVLIDGEPKLLTTYSLQGLQFPTLPFLDQVNRNFGKNVGLSLQIPIYNNHQARLGIQQAKISREQSRLNSEQVRQQMRTTIEGALQSARAALLQYRAALDAVEAQRAAFDAASRRYELGAANAVELSAAKTSLDIAENQLILAKYDYLFRIKILDFYQGKPLTLN